MLLRGCWLELKELSFGVRAEAGSQHHTDSPSRGVTTAHWHRECKRSAKLPAFVRAMDGAKIKYMKGNCDVWKFYIDMW